MRSALSTRVLLGASSIVAGIVSFIWHDSDAWQRLHPLGAAAPAIIGVLAFAQIAGGVALPFTRTMRPAAAVLAFAYAFFTVECAPGILSAPRDPSNYVDLFEQLSIVCGMLAILDYRRTARIGYGICTLSFAWAQAVYPQYTASLVPSWIPPSQMFWTILTTVAFALAAIAMLMNVRTRLALQCSAAMMALFGILVWVPHIIASPHALSNWDEIAANYLITGAALAVMDGLRASVSSYAAKPLR